VASDRSSPVGETLHSFSTADEDLVRRIEHDRQLQDGPHTFAVVDIRELPPVGLTRRWRVCLGRMHSRAGDPQENRW
jgi:hypothetical protein